MQGLKNKVIMSLIPSSVDLMSVFGEVIIESRIS